jgi:hypothetical protein
VARGGEAVNPPNLSPKCPASLEYTLKSRVFQWLRRKENFKELPKNVEKRAKTVGTVGSMENNKALQIRELRRW